MSLNFPDQWQSVMDNVLFPDIIIFSAKSTDLLTVRTYQDDLLSL